jgi:seryl-tRNA synthetase
VPDKGFPLLDHVELGRRLQLLDFERGVKVSGTRFYFLRGAGALLHARCLLRARPHGAQGFEPMEVPVLGARSGDDRHGLLPGGEEQAYRLDARPAQPGGHGRGAADLFRAGEILPVRAAAALVALSHCFRREAGAAARTRAACTASTSSRRSSRWCPARRRGASASSTSHLRNAEELLRRSSCPTASSTSAAATSAAAGAEVRHRDLDAQPQGYGETHSASRFHDFQARRLELRYRDAGQVRFCHTLNNTVVASPRILIPILELYQQKDGSVVRAAGLRPVDGRARGARAEAGLSARGGATCRR